MNINPKIFKAYDIRGVYNQDFNDETAYKIGLAYSSLRREELEDKGKLEVVVGRDMRLSSPALMEKLIQGLVESGVDVLDIGLASTPTFYFAVAHYGYGGGILVSASHNPQEYNGFKLVREKAIPISGDTGMYRLRDMVLDLKISPAAEPGQVSKKSDVLAEQVSHEIKFSDIGKIKPLKIVIDPANSMGALYFDELFGHLPCSLVRMNWELDGTFPAHEADPFKPENLEPLCEMVKREKADLGIATDGDGDRIFFVDETGTPVDPGITRAILCKIFLAEKPGSKIAYDIRPGRITPDTILENGGQPVVTRVGHSLIKEQARQVGAYFAGESSGHFYLNMQEGCYEIPVIVTLKLLEEISASGGTFSKLVKPYQKYHHSGEINSKVENPEKKIEEIKNRYSTGRQSELDGITVEYEDWWFNVRASNTEPLLRLNLEARSKGLMEEKRDEVLGIIRG